MDWRWVEPVGGRCSGAHPLVQACRQQKARSSELFPFLFRKGSWVSLVFLSLITQFLRIQGPLYISAMVCLSSLYVNEILPSAVNCEICGVVVKISSNVLCVL